jgi:hypothetical protein
VIAAPAIPARRLAGASALAMAAAFNLPYAALALLYDYPAVLRRPAAEALALFHAGGPALVLAWHGFMLAALALVPLAAALALTPARVLARPALAVGAAIAGGLSGLAQAVGLSRWVFAVPALARTHADPSVAPAARETAEASFMLLNAWGGVAIGEHLGQLLLALFLLLMGILQRAEARPTSARLAFLSAVLIALGTGEGLALALGSTGDPFSLVTVAGFLGLTAWLAATGLSLLRHPA